MKKNILGVGFSDVNQEEVLEYIVKRLQKNSKKYYIVTPNPEILVAAQKDKEYKSILNDAELALPDGIGIIIASKILGVDFKQRIPGTDLVYQLCKEVSKRPITVGFLGGAPQLAEKTAECLRQKYPELKVSFTGSEYSDVTQKARKISKSDRQIIRNSELLAFRQSGSPSFPKTDILFVAFGSPKQEFWISENLDKIPVKIAIGVGGAFDFISGSIPRAPKFLRWIGLEWLFRLVVQPWRIKRQLSLFTFTFLIIKEKLGIVE